MSKVALTILTLLVLLSGGKALAVDHFMDCSVANGTGGSGTFADPFESVDDLIAASLGSGDDLYILAGSECIESHTGNNSDAIRVDWGGTVTVGCYWNDGGSPNTDCKTTSQTRPIINHDLGLGATEDWGETYTGWPNNNCGGTLDEQNGFLIDQANVTVEYIHLKNICASAFVMNYDGGGDSVADGFTLRDSIIEDTGAQGVRERCGGQGGNFSLDCTDDVTIVRNEFYRIGRNYSSGSTSWNGWGNVISVGGDNAYIAWNHIEDAYAEGIASRFTKDTQNEASRSIFEYNTIVNVGPDMIHIASSYVTARYNWLFATRRAGVQSGTSTNNPAHPDYWAQRLDTGDYETHCKTDGGNWDACSRGIGSGSDGCGASDADCSPVSNIEIYGNIIVGTGFGINLHNGKSRTQDNWLVANNTMVGVSHCIYVNKQQAPTTNVEIKNNACIRTSTNALDNRDLRITDFNGGNTGWDIDYNLWTTDPPSCVGACTNAGTGIEDSDFDNANDLHYATDTVNLGATGDLYQSITDFSTVDMSDFYFLAGSATEDAGTSLGASPDSCATADPACLLNQNSPNATDFKLELAYLIEQDASWNIGSWNTFSAAAAPEVPTSLTLNSTLPLELPGNGSACTTLTWTQPAGTTPGSFRFTVGSASGVPGVVDGKSVTPYLMAATATTGTTSRVASGQACEDMLVQFFRWTDNPVYIFVSACEGTDGTNCSAYGASFSVGFNDP